jgi:hypothetical protein
MSLPRLVSVDYHSLMKRRNTLAAQIIPPPSSPPARPTASDILQFLKEYESLGFTNGHRTGYSVHNDSAKWLANAVAGDNKIDPLPASFCFATLMPDSAM